MQVPEEVRQSVNLLFPFQVLAELLGYSSAWSSPSEISSCPSPSFHFFAFPRYVCISPALCHRSFLTTTKDLSRFQASLQLEQSPPFYTCSSPATPANIWEWGTLTSCDTSQVLPSLSCSPSVKEKMPPGWMLQEEGWTVDEARGSKRSDFQDPKCSSGSTACPCWALLSVGCWLFRNFWGQIYTAAKSSGLFR